MLRFNSRTVNWVMKSNAEITSILLWDVVLQFSSSVVSDSLRPYGLQHARPLCPSPTPRACSNSCPSSWWGHPTSSCSVTPFSFCPQSFPASGSFPMSPSNLLYFMSIESLMLSKHLILCHPILLPSIFLNIRNSGSFPVSLLFASGGRSIGVSTLAIVLPMNIQNWFPLRSTGLVFLLSKGLLRVFSSTTIWKHQFFITQPSLCPTLTSIHDYWKNQ